MIFAAAPLGSIHLGAPLIDPGAITDPTSLDPIRIEWNGRLVGVRVETIEKVETQGQPVSLRFTLVNPLVEPVVGDRIRMLYHESLEFAGTIEYVNKVTSDLQVYEYQCECLDYGQILTRRQVRRNFTNMTVQAIVDAILDQELVGEGLTLGTIDSREVVPLVDASQSTRVWDLFRDLASATGQIFRVGFDRTILMTSSTEEAAPLVLNEANVLVETTEVKRDRETYRNRQVIHVTGTPPDTDTDALTVTVEQNNQEQIDERAAIEGGSGIYEEYEELVHPTSNLRDDLLLLGNGYASLRLSTSGTTRILLGLTARGYGFRAGQIATVELPSFSVAGEFVIQRVTLGERGGRYLFHKLELTSSSAQRRAYESWLSVLSKGKIAIQVFGSVMHDSVTFTTPGATNWNVPAGVSVITMTLKGASGGGGGGGGCFPYAKTGGAGGNGGKVVTSVNVVAGEELNLVLGANGVAGVNRATVVTEKVVHGSAGTAGTVTTVHRAGVLLSQANAGQGGGGNVCPSHGTNGAHGGGNNGLVTVGGGKVGGTKGTTNYPASGGDVAPTNGKDASVTIEW